MTLRSASGVHRFSFPAIGSTASLVVTDPAEADAALNILRVEIDAIDRAASRFRPDSELCRLNAAAGTSIAVSGLLLQAVGESIRASRLTDGLVDPTVGEALVMAGYDRDFGELSDSGPRVAILAKRVPGWRGIHIDEVEQTIRLPLGVSLDLGATAKALCADKAADRIAVETGTGVLVNLGGDIAVRGVPPDGGWSIRITDNHATPPELAEGPVVSIQSGGLATSSTLVRRWIRGGEQKHHLIDPATGLPATEHWTTVSVAAASCLDANIASCAAILLGPSAPGWLAERSLPARLVHASGEVISVAGWPQLLPC